MGENRTGRRIQFNDRVIASLKPPATGRDEYFDASKNSPIGFGIRVSSGRTGDKKVSKAWFRLYRDKGGKLKRWTIGRYPEVGLAEARDQADKKKHTDPAAEKAKRRELMSFRELADKFFADPSIELKPSTAERWRWINKKYLEPQFGDFSPLDIQDVEIEAFLDAKAKTHPFQANRIFELIRRLYSYAAAKKTIAVAPADYFKRFGRFGLKAPFQHERNHARKRWFKDHEIRRILKALELEPRWKQVMYELYLRTGCRKSELLDARWEDFEFQTEIPVWNMPETKNGDEHVLALPESIVDLLQELRGPNAGEKDHVISRGESGRRHDPEGDIERLRRRTGIENLRLHDFRRTLGSHMPRLRVGENQDKIGEKVISMILNHTPPGPRVSQTYIRHGYAEEIRDALAAWSDELDRFAAMEEPAPKVVGIDERR